MPEEIKQEVVVKTQKYLGKYVKKPTLSEKLLKKPPFRFLHDVINTVIKETGFLKGLFSDEELNSENVKEKEAKLAFLTKLIDAVKTVTNTDLAVRPSKIIAGLEPTETNLLLQTIGKAIEKKVDSSEYVKKLHSGQIISTEKSKKSKKTTDKNEKAKKPKTSPQNEEKTSVTKTKEKVIKNETPKSTDREKNKKRSSSKDSKPKPEFNEAKTKNKDKSKKQEKNKEIVSSNSVEDTKLNDITQAPNLETIKDNTINETASLSNEPLINDAISNRSIPDEALNTSSEPSTVPLTELTTPTEPETKKRSPSASRPKSARPRSGDLKPVQEDNKEPVYIESRPKTSLRPPSVRPSSARPGAPRLRPESALPIKEVVPMGKIKVIVESFDKDDEEETVIIQTNHENLENQNDVEVPTENKGHLVEQILEQINENDGSKNGANAENEWQKDIFYGKDATTKDTNNLRSLIQSLTKTANPLGKLLNYLHEDIDAMHAELQSWTHTKRQLFDEIAKQKKITTEMNKPLVAQLERLNQEIKKVEEELVNTRHNILRNDTKIKELLLK